MIWYKSQDVSRFKGDKYFNLIAFTLRALFHTLILFDIMFQLSMVSFFLHIICNCKKTDTERGEASMRDPPAENKRNMLIKEKERKQGL